jgi:hypothetical protein
MRSACRLRLDPDSDDSRDGLDALTAEPEPDSASADLSGTAGLKL